MWVSMPVCECIYIFIFIDIWLNWIWHKIPKCIVYRQRIYIYIYFKYPVSVQGQ